LIRHDIEKAKEIWRNKIRRARTPILADLDVKYMRALEDGSDVNIIVQNKEQLRNYPNKVEIEQATNVEQLKEIWDNDLLGEKD
jgi:hypothetical protein|tara:strand:- start:2379 stop:2630 length:252 start_codon:yes stop_codon:yes gene_type:complete